MVAHQEWLAGLKENFDVNILKITIFILIENWNLFTKEEFRMLPLWVLFDNQKITIFILIENWNLFTKEEFRM